MEKQIISLTDKLVSIPSVKEDVASLDKVLLKSAEELKGFSKKLFVKNDIPSVIYYNTAKLPKRFKIILNAHLDVVPGKVTQYKTFSRGDKLYGRGTSDMKGAAACMILVYKELAKKLNYEIGLQLVTDEEVGGFNGVKYQIEKGIKADFVIAGEPTDLCVNDKAKGVIWAKLITKGVSAHGAYPWNGENAIHMMRRALDELYKTFPVPSKETWKTTVNLAKLESSNETFNKVPDDCTAWLDIRYIPEEKNTVISKLKKAVPKYAKLEIMLKEPAQFTDKNNVYIELLRQSVISVTGKNTPVIVKHGASDIRHYNEAGCDGVTFGPVGEGLHTDDEWVSVEGLSDYYRVLKGFLMSVS